MRIRWLTSNHFEKADLQCVIAGIANEAFIGEINSGFLMERQRSRFIEAKYVERFDWVETVSDPFGTSQEISRHEFQQTNFRISLDSPTIEIYDSPRSISPLLNRLESFLGLDFVVSSPDVAVLDWLNQLGDAIEQPMVTSVSVSKLSLSPQTFAQISIRGTEDVREQVVKIAGKKSYKIEKLIVSAIYDNEPIRFMLRSDARATIIKGSEDIIPFLRDGLAPSLVQS